ncbi:MAG TPA: RidA family protein [Gammaproteobacteria bacterium]|jgi:reactive intermediate/imine deaminase|nr:RidA family protein [Gammaproteobacteria bacterium]
MKKQPIHRDTAWDRKMHYSQAVRVGDTIYVSGQVALDDEGKVVGPGDIVAQTRQAVRNIESILASQGATLRDVVKITVFIANRTPGFVMAYDNTLGEFFPEDCPASTLVEVKSLVLRELLVEIESVAVIGSGV